MRVVHHQQEVRVILHKVCAQQFPNLIFSSKGTGEAEATGLKIEDIGLESFDEVKPDRHNLGELICQFLEENDLKGKLTKTEILDKVKLILDQLDCN